MSTVRISGRDAGFDRAASRYDRLVGWNPGYHRNLRAAARQLRLPRNGSGAHILDLGCGTGASTAALLRAAPLARITGVDASAGMLERARAKAWPDTVEFLHSTVGDLDPDTVDAPVDAVFAAYLVRNLPDVPRGLQAIRRLLRPGAPLCVHDYTLEPGTIARPLWHAVCWSVIIPAGRAATGDGRLYRYLWRSVLDFDSPGRLAQRLRAAGFAPVSIARAAGWQRHVLHSLRTVRPDSGEEHRCPTATPCDIPPHPDSPM